MKNEFDEAALDNFEIMRTFVKIRALLLLNQDLARKLDDLEKKCDSQFKAVFDAIRQLMKTLEVPRPRIGIVADDRGTLSQSS